MDFSYLDGLTGGRGVVFATGTPISNPMVEMFAMKLVLRGLPWRYFIMKAFDFKGFWRFLKC